ncbi:MAG: DUF3782 domain-containing protein [Candidatus Caldarchaeum sp.]
MSIKEEFLKLLKEDETFRYTVAGYIGLTEILSRIDANTADIKVLQEQVKTLQDQVRTLQEQVKALQEQVAKQGEILAEHTVRLDKLTRTLGAIGTRWGILSESAFREGLKGVVEKHFGGKISRWGL